MRYIPLTEADREKALLTIGVPSVEALFEDIPATARLSEGLDLPRALAEQELLSLGKRLANRNNIAEPENTFLGAGAYPHAVPAAVDQLTLRSEFYTAYTPYQPEISQGSLMAIHEFQTYVAALFGMDLANASLYDGASAMAEAVIMAGRISRKKKVLLSSLVHPLWREVTATYAQGTELELVTIDDFGAGQLTIPLLEKKCDDQCGALVVSYPNFLGHHEELADIRSFCDSKKLLLIVAVPEPVALGLLKPPGDYGADIVVGEGRSFGGSLSYGGPGLGLFATRDKWARQLPGRLVGKTTDKEGREGFVLTLATREQHIRRDKATSNICSNQALCATAFAIHMSLLGKAGLRELALRNVTAAHYLKERVSSLVGFDPLFTKTFFNEVAFTTPLEPEVIQKRLADQGIVAGFDITSVYPSAPRAILFCATDVTTKASIDRLVTALAEFER